MEHTNILDEKNSGVVRLYCDKSLRFLFYSLVFFVIELLILTITFYLELLMSLSLTLAGIPIIAILMTAGLGFWYATQSIRSREQYPVKKTLGLLGNLLMLGIIFLALLALIPSKVEPMPIIMEEATNEVPPRDTIE